MSGRRPSVPPADSAGQPPPHVRTPLQHLELSMASDDGYESSPALRVVRRNPLDGWLDAAHHSEDACLVLDADGVVAGISDVCLDALGLSSAEEILGRGMLDDVVDFVDFAGVGVRPVPADLAKIPPLLALHSGGLARGLIRVRTSGRITTLDAVSAAIRADGGLVGSVTFLSEV